MAIGAAIGLFCGPIIDDFLKNSNGFLDVVIKILTFFVMVFMVYYIQTIVHEAGHLVFGLLTGYKFCSFRIGKNMFVIENGKLKCIKYGIQSTGGQCLMVPPNWQGDNTPYMLYHLGGSLLNLIVGLISFGLYLLFKNIPYLSLFLLLSSGICLLIVIMNGVPLKLGGVNNDGYNALEIWRNKKANKVMWQQLKINEMLMNGASLLDVPASWFVLPEADEMNNSIIATSAVYIQNRYLGNHQYDKALELAKSLINNENAIMGIHKNLLKLDVVYCELLKGNTSAVDEFLDKDVKNTIKAMPTFISVLRTNYAIALLKDNDEAQAKKIMETFDKVATKYPYQGEVTIEKSLMEVAKQNWQNTQQKSM